MSNETNSSELLNYLDACEDIVALSPQIVARFYRDGNRLGQRAANAPQPDYFQPERWIGSSTQAANPPGIPTGGLSVCPGLVAKDQSGQSDQAPTLRSVLAHTEAGSRLLGQKRYDKHDGRFRLLLKLLDPGLAIPFHVHANDAFVKAHPDVYPNDSFGKEEAYHYLDLPKGTNPYTHLGLHPGVTVKDLVEAVNRGEDHVLELSPEAYLRYGEGFYVPSGILHRPGTALTLEAQQPSDVNAWFQRNFGKDPIPESMLYRGFKTHEEAAEAVIDWDMNLREDLLTTLRLKPEPVMKDAKGGKMDWVFPPDATEKFSGIRVTVETEMTLKFKQPCVLFVWRGMGKLGELAITGGGGLVTANDEFFVGVEALAKGVSLTNTGQEPLVVYVMFGESLG